MPFGALDGAFSQSKDLGQLYSCFTQRFTVSTRPFAGGSITILIYKFTVILKYL